MIKLPYLLSAEGKAGGGMQHLPGLGLHLGLTLFALSLVILLPLSALLMTFLNAQDISLWGVLKDSRVWRACRLTMTCALAAALINSLAGFVVAWVLVRYRFRGRRFLDALVDLPFALPTAVSGIALTTLYSPKGWLGAPLAALNIPVIFTPLGITLAMVMIGLPFVVRSLQPALLELNAEWEEAAHSLGATAFTSFCKIVLPLVFPSLITGFSLALARGLGEYGSVVFISGNLPGRTEIASLLIMTRLEQYDLPGATALALLLLSISFFLLLMVNLIQSRSARRCHHE